ncbi:uncharacterized protein EI97DRAFT_198783 [Westerdykella ornata]|uniref:Uncharacterized protein n=1 Tax=Westerdykella ornata TaxID=318751 RepID=A0A6A6JAR7_WESOR|nr:uncharacterized protein EI97DRAFT_198783 [Westerdykella ornata]KAF2272716.1 hypothetical protein EI97DRAFT_198783 [Westerdykella ornata]
MDRLAAARNSSGRLMKLCPYGGPGSYSTDMIAPGSFFRCPTALAPEDRVSGRLIAQSARYYFFAGSRAAARSGANAGTAVSRKGGSSGIILFGRLATGGRVPTWWNRIHFTRKSVTADVGYSERRGRGRKEVDGWTDGSCAVRLRRCPIGKAANYLLSSIHARILKISTSRPCKVAQQEAMLQEGLTFDMQDAVFLLQR